MLSPECVRKDLRDIRYYYSRKAELDSAAKELGALPVLRTVERYNCVIRKAPIILYDLYACLLRHKFMDTLKIKVSETKSKRMSSVNPYAFCYLSELLSLCRKTEAISILYTISISRSLPVIFGKPPTMIRSISS